MYRRRDLELRNVPWSDYRSTKSRLGDAISDSMGQLRISCAVSSKSAVVILEAETLVIESEEE